MHYNDQGADFKYLIVNERDKRFGLSVTTVGFQLLGPEAFIHHATTGRLLFTAQKGRVLHEYQLVYIRLKDRGTFRQPTQPRLSTYPSRYFSCFPDSGIPMRRCKRQDGTNITSVLKARL